MLRPLRPKPCVRRVPTPHVPSQEPALAPSPAPAIRSDSESLLDLEVPQFFRAGETPLYAVWHGTAAAPRRAVVHVHGLGVEHLTSYRNPVRLARAAAAN